jgi:hypothetical protein
VEEIKGLAAAQSIWRAFTVPKKIKLIALFILKLGHVAMAIVAVDSIIVHHFPKRF